MIVEDEPPPLLDYYEEFTELEAKVERLEQRITELEAVIDEIADSEDSLRNISKDDENAGRETGHNKKMGDREETDLIEATATFYTARCEGCIGITKTGYDVRETVYSDSGRRIIAVDPSHIALGSVVNIELENGDTFEAEALDIGGDIKGARIDVLVETKVEAFRLGRQSAKIEIIEEGKR